MGPPHPSPAVPGATNGDTMHQFPRLSDALAAGYTSPRRGPSGDADISGPRSYGYEFRASDGRKTVLVYFTEDPDKLGRPGCFRPMYPPAA